MLGGGTGADASLPFGALRSLRVLAVDDEPMMTRAVIRMLKPSGHVVTVAASGEEALEEWAERGSSTWWSRIWAWGLA